MTGVLLYIREVKGLLKDVIDWQSLGLELRVLYSTLKKIEKDYGKVDPRARDCRGAFMSVIDPSSG